MKAVPDALKRNIEPDESVTRLPDFVDRGTADEIWLRRAGAGRYVILTKDDRLRYRPNERRALIEANTAVFMVSSLSGDVMGARLVHALPTMRRVLRGYAPPLVGSVQEDGSIRLRLVGGEDVSKMVKRPR